MPCTVCVAALGEVSCMARGKPTKSTKERLAKSPEEEVYVISTNAQEME